VSITSGGSIGSGGFTSTSSGTTLTITGVTASVNDEIILPIAADNYHTTFGYLHDIASVTDSAGNSWAILNDNTNDAAYTYSPTSTQNDGATIALFHTKVTSALSSGTITITLGHAKTAKAASPWKFTVGAEMRLAVMSSKTVGAGKTFDSVSRYTAWPLSSLSISGLQSNEYLFFRATGGEIATSPGSVTYTSGFSNINERIANTGSSPTSMICGAEFKVETTTSKTSSPAIDMYPGTRDFSSIMIALKEVPIASAAGGMMMAVGF